MPEAAEFILCFQVSFLIKPESRNPCLSKAMAMQRTEDSLKKSRYPLLARGSYLEFEGAAGAFWRFVKVGFE